MSDKYGGRPRQLQDVAPLAQHETVRKWLAGLKDGHGRTTALYSLARYLRWRADRGLETDPDLLVGDCLDGTTRTLVRHVDEALEYAQSLEDSAPSTKERNYKAVRSFYQGNRVTLPKAKLRAPRLSEGVKVEAEITATDFLGMVKRALEYGGVRDRAIILLTLQAGMDDSTLAQVFNFVAFPQLAKHFGLEDWTKWDASRCPVRVILNRPKSDYRYYSFVDVDALEALKLWLNVRGAVRVYPPDNPSLLPKSDPLFVTRDGAPITAGSVCDTYRKVGKRAGLNVSNGTKVSSFRGAKIRYPFHSHEVRDVVVSLARSCGADVPVAQFLTGHNIDRLKYDKSAWNDVPFFRAQYLKIARPRLNPISGRVLEAEAEVSKRFESRLATLEGQIEAALAKRRPRP